MNTEKLTNNIKLLTERLLSVENKIEKFTKNNDLSTKEEIIFENAHKDSLEDGTGGLHPTEKRVKDIKDGRLESALETISFEKKERIKEEKHEEDIEQKISAERKNYAEGLTIHGANRIAAGKPLNRAIWSILVLSSFLVAVLISKEHFQ
eukprot:TCONS_00060978-protein